jgi:sugar phosphate isomerase/epimerase
MIDFGAVTHAVSHEPIPFERALEQIRAIGFRQILLLTSRDGPVIRLGEATTSHYPNLRDTRPADLRRVVADAGLTVGAILAPVRMDLAAPAAAREFAEQLAPYTDYAGAMGCPAVCTSVPRAEAPLLPLAAKRDAILRFAESIDTAAARLPAAGPTVSVDVHYHSLLETVDDCRLFLEAMPARNAGVLLNIGHLTTAEQEGWRLIEEYPDRLPVIGWKDHSLRPDRPRPVWSIELGTGDSPFSEYVRAFRRMGPPSERLLHLINVENEPPERKIEALAHSLAYMQRLWEGVEASSR